MPNRKRTKWHGLTTVIAVMVVAVVTQARSFRVNMMPNGGVNRCSNCHVNPGGGGTRTPFGQDVFAIVGGPSATPFWSRLLAEEDSDGDGFTNGEEVGDPDGDGTATPGALVTNPGDPNSRPPTNQAPSVSIIQPAGGSSFTLPAVVDVSANASDSDGTVVKVEFFNGDRSLGTATASPYTVRADLAVGLHSLTAEATDDQDASTTSSTVQVTVAAPSPVTISEVDLGEAGLALSWEAGGGPFAVQGRTTVDEVWVDIGPVTVEREATLPVSGAMSIFRVADLAGQDPVELITELSGGAARPDPVVTDGTGSGEFTLQGNTLSFDVSYSGLSAVAIGAHIHGPATQEETAGVLIDLGPFNGGGFGTSGTLSGGVVLDNEQKAAILSGLTYVNIHTSAHPGGEIRGQILR